MLGAEALDLFIVLLRAQRVAQVSGESPELSNDPASEQHFAVGKNDQESRQHAVPKSQEDLIFHLLGER